MYPSMLKALGWLPALQKLDVMAYVFVLPALARYRELKIILSLHGSLRPAWDTGDLVSKKRKKKPEEALGGVDVLTELKQLTCARGPFQVSRL